MTLAKQTLACGPRMGLQMRGCRDSTLHAGSWLQLHSSLRCFPQMSSPSSITLPSQVPPVWETRLSFLHPASSPWLAPSKNGGIVCRCAWREASPSALGEHVVWECLRWRSFKLSPTQHAGVWLSWMTMLNPPPTSESFSGWGDTSNPVDAPGEAAV